MRKILFFNTDCIEVVTFHLPDENYAELQAEVDQLQIAISDKSWLPIDAEAVTQIIDLEDHFDEVYSVFFNSDFVTDLIDPKSLFEYFRYIGFINPNQGKPAMSVIKPIEELFEFQRNSRNGSDLSTALSMMRAVQGQDTERASVRRTIETSNSVLREHAELLKNFAKSNTLGLGVEAVKPSSYLVIYHTDQEVIGVAEIESSPTNIMTKITGEASFVNKFHTYLKEMAPRTARMIRTLTQSMFGIRECEEMLPIRPSEEVAAAEHYPYLPSPGKLLHDFMESDAKVLVLIGPPGTGKSTYLRAMIGDIAERRHIYTAASAVIHANPNLLEIMKNSRADSVFIFEDSDMLIASRTEGNHQMSEILNITDGITTSNRKFIFSTNLDNLSKVDKALLRPGRCFGAYRFRALNEAEAAAVYTMHDIPMPITYTDSTLAEILNPPNDYTDNPATIVHTTPLLSN